MGLFGECANEDKEGKIKPFYPDRSSVGETLAPLKRSAS